MKLVTVRLSTFGPEPEGLVCGVHPYCGTPVERALYIVDAPKYHIRVMGEWVNKRVKEERKDRPAGVVHWVTTRFHDINFACQKNGEVGMIEYICYVIENERDDTNRSWARDRRCRSREASKSPARATTRDRNTR